MHTGLKPSDQRWTLMKLLVFAFSFSLPLTTSAQEFDQKDNDSLLVVLKTKISQEERAGILLSVAQYHIFKPGENKIDFDSAEAYMSQAAKINRSLKSAAIDGFMFLTKGYLMKERGQKEEAQKLVQKAVDVLEKSNNKFYLGRAYYELSNFYSYKDVVEIEKRISLVQKSISAFDAVGAIKDKAFSLKMLGDLYSAQRDFGKAKDALLLSLAAYESINYPRLQALYDILGRLYKYFDDYKHALQYQLLALRAAEANKDSTIQIGIIHNTLGTLYKETGRKDIAIGYYQKALQTAIRYADTFAVALIVFNTSVCFDAYPTPQSTLDFLQSIPKPYRNATGPLEKSWMSVAYINALSLLPKRYDEAQSHAAILEKTVDHDEIPDEFRSVMYSTLASHFLKTRNYGKARNYLKKNKQYYNLPGAIKRMATDARLFYLLDSAQGDYRSAFSHSIRYKSLSDSLLNEMKSRQMQQLEVEYETAKKQDSIKLKDKDILVLKQRESLNEANLKRADLVQNFTIAAIIFFAAIAALIYRQYRSKQQKNILISSQNQQLQHLLTEKEWLLKEVHHRVKNNLHTVICLLESQAAYLNNDALRAIQQSQHRIYAMSLIHQKLYQSDDIRLINMQQYLSQFIEYLGDSFDVSDRIKFSLDVEDINLNVSQAIPVALILNEAVTNAIKYAFPDNRSGTVAVSMHRVAGRRIKVQIRDDGIGMKPPKNINRVNSLGLQLISGLSSELRGEIMFENDNGTKITITFNQDSWFENTYSEKRLQKQEVSM